MRIICCIFVATSLLACSSTRTRGPSTVPTGGVGVQLEGVQSWEEVVPPGHPTRFTVERATGVAREEVARLVSSSASALDDCVGPHAGKISVRLQRRAGALDVELLQSSSLDPREERCVLDALTRIKSSTPTTPAEPRSDGFTSLVSVEW